MLQQALLIMQFLDMIIDLVQKMMVKMPDSEGKARAEAVISLITSFDSQFKNMAPMLANVVEWAYQNFVKKPEVAASTATTVAVK